jgi:hypothetical protein
LYFVVTFGPVLGRRIPALVVPTTAMPNWEEEEFGVALIDIWNSLCCIAIGKIEKIYHPIKLYNSL